MKSFAWAVTAASLALAAPAFAASVPSDHDTAANRMTAALNILEAKGYGAFNDFRADGKDYTAAVAQDGHRFTVLIDPDNGQVTRQG